jgi:abortive infection bacteriophage resistance protein
MNSFNRILFPLVFLLTLIINVSSTYTHAAFVNAIRQSQQKYQQSRSISMYDASEEYSLQMNNTALLGLQPCSHMQCKKIAIVGAG